MSKPTSPTSVRTAGSIFALSGALIALVGSQMKLQAQLVSGQGAAIGTVQKPELQLAMQEVVMKAAPQADNSGSVLAFGMLMMLIGIGLHAWYILNKEEGTPVPIRIRKHKAKKPQAKKSPRKSRRQAEVIWIERTIRF